MESVDGLDRSVDKSKGVVNLSTAGNRNSADLVGYNLLPTVVSGEGLDFGFAHDFYVLE